MKRDQVVTQVVARSAVRESMVELAKLTVGKWLEAYPEKFVFGPKEVMAGQRLLKRELGLR